MRPSSANIAGAPIDPRIKLIRGQRVLLSNDLADLYLVEHRALMQAVRRNIERFPDDFIFQVSQDEWDDLKSQFVTSSWGGVRKLPYAFTEQGVAMLSSVLRSDRAVRVNVEIMRAFVRLRRLLSENKELTARLDALEQKYDSSFRAVFEAIRQMMIPPPQKKRAIGFTTEIDESNA